jgi:hypothetical protein
MVTVAIRTLELEYLLKISDRGRSRNRYISTDSDSDADSTALISTIAVVRPSNLKTKGDSQIPPTVGHRYRKRQQIAPAITGFVYVINILNQFVTEYFTKT